MTQASERGLTLVEMLVVLAIIGVATAAAVLAMGGHDGSGQAEAQRLRARIQLAADDAMIGDADLALAVTPNSYAVLERRDAGLAWQPATLSGLGAVTQLPAGMRLAAPAGGAPLPLAAGRPFAIGLARGAQHWTVAFDGLRATLNPAAGTSAPS